jgi:hypothetical protein
LEEKAIGRHPSCSLFEETYDYHKSMLPALLSWKDAARQRPDQTPLCDEPSGDLDRDPAQNIPGLVQSLHRQHGKIIDGGARSDA